MPFSRIESPINWLWPVLQLLGSDDGHAQNNAGEIRRRYRQLAAAVHPDKCSLTGAARAFQKLQQGVQQLLEADSREAGWAWRDGSKERDGKRRKGEGGSNIGARGEDDGLDEVIDDEWLASDNGGFPWWGEWDPPDPQPGGPLPSQQQQQQQQRQAVHQPAGSGPGPLGQSGSHASGGQCPQQQPQGAGAGICLNQVTGEGRHESDPAWGTIGGSSTSSSLKEPEEDDERWLGELGLADLRGEVRRRQDALLGGGGQQGPRLSTQELQARLRWALRCSLTGHRVRMHAHQVAHRRGLAGCACARTPLLHGMLRLA
jgi:hypothetical protein